ncbi:MAG TPA: metallophosphoesterase [Firmicutes bacterium]|nr:metallophosphoesterase [Bacillota bacterium]
MLIKKKKITVFFYLVLLPLIFAVYIFFLEPNNLQKTYLIIESDKIPGEATPLKIIHLTDFHIDKIGWRENRVIQILELEEPDLILLSGDYLNDRSKGDELGEYIQRMVEIAPVYFTLGNWDNEKINKNIVNAGGTSVFERFLTVNLDGVRFDLFSIKYNWAYIGEDRERERISELLQERTNDYFTIFLAHTPDHVPVAVDREIDLMLAGHTHGGQFRLPFFGSFFTDSKFGKKYERGYHKIANTILYVNRGIGMTGNIKLRVRAFCPPEILILTIKPETNEN